MHTLHLHPLFQFSHVSSYTSVASPDVAIAASGEAAAAPKMWGPPSSMAMHMASYPPIHRSGEGVKHPYPPSACCLCTGSAADHPPLPGITAIACAHMHAMAHFWKRYRLWSILWGIMHSSFYTECLWDFYLALHVLALVLPEQSVWSSAICTGTSLLLLSTIVTIVLLVINLAWLHSSTSCCAHGSCSWKHPVVQAVTWCGTLR